MTKKLTDAQLSMEPQLDIDSFLNADDDGDDDDLSSAPHRSLDELLNNSSDSDDADMAPPLRSSSLPLSQQQQQTATNPNNIIKESDYSLSRVKSGGFASSTRPLPSLFGGVRPNAKPGAALAAAAAASRSIPTPYAAAIKSRRSALSLRAVRSFPDRDSSDSGSVGCGDHEVVSNSSNGGGDSTVVGVVDGNEGVQHLEIRASSGDSGGQELVNGGNVDTTTSVLDSSVGLNLDDGQLFVTDLDDVKVDSMLSLHVEDDGSTPKVLEENESNYVGVSSDVSKVDDAGGNEEDSRIVVPLEEEAGGLDIETGRLEDDGELGASTSGSEDEDIGDISELVEERIGKLESERNSKKKVEKKQMKPLESAEELEKKQASTGFHLEEGAAAQPMRLEGVRRGSTTLGYFDVDANNAITRTISSQGFRRDNGSTQALAVHVNYIAVGTAKGVIVVFPSRYSPHNVDTMDIKMLMLGLQGDRSHASVTSMCFNQQGDLLLAGYSDGHVIVWDVQKASAAKTISGEHTAPVVHTLFLGQDSQVTRQFKAVTGDCKGIVLLHAFSVVPLLNRINIKTQCLLDGQRTGTVVSASPLIFDELGGGLVPFSQGNAPTSSSSIGGMMGGVVGGDAGWKLFNEGSSLVEEGVVIFVTYQTALVVRLTPTLQVYAQLPRPDGVREGSMPYSAWKSTPLSRPSPNENITLDAVERVSLLAIAWDRKVLVAKLVNQELKVCSRWSLDSAAIGVAWLDTELLVILTLTGQLYFCANDGTIIHQTSFSVDNSSGEDLVAYHTHFSNVYGNPEKASHNSIAVRGASVYILGSMHLIICRLLPWKERIHVLRTAGDWMGSLNMAITLYDGQLHGVVDLPRSVEAVREAIMPYLVELLLAYVDEVFSYISVAFCNQIGKVELQDDPKSGSSSVHSEIKEQFTRVGGVAVEFCVHIRRTDILFEEIFTKFIAVQHRDTFLELLEPYILRDMLGSLPPEIMQALVEHYNNKGWLQRVEQCVLHMDISSVDFNQVVRLCREHGLYGALVYLFNKGLDDFRSPLEELLVVFQNCHRENAAALGYRMLVYLKYCFLGLAFPPGHGAIPPSRLPTLRKDLVQFLLEDPTKKHSLAQSCLFAGGKYLNLYHLLELDTEATLDVLRCAFPDEESHMSDLTSQDSDNERVESTQNNASQNLLIQNTVDALVNIIESQPREDESASIDEAGQVGAWPSKTDRGHLFDFIAFYVACKRARISKSVLGQILEYLTLDSDPAPSVPTHPKEYAKRREKQVLALLEAVPADWNATYVLKLCEKAEFHQVCGLIHTIRHQYLAALDSYMKDVGEPIHTFSYISNMLQQLRGNEFHVFRSAIFSRIPELVTLSREGTFVLIIDHFSNETSRILSDLRSHPKSLFMYLKNVIEVHLSGTLNFSSLQRDDNVNVFSGRRVNNQSEVLETYLEKISSFPMLMRNNPVTVTDDMIEQYLELLCQYEPNSVLKFLETFDSYRVEHCLRLCQEYGIIDAASFLLERVGDVGSALIFTLSGLNDTFAELETAVDSVCSSIQGPANNKRYKAVLKLKQVDQIRSMLHACIGLCQRNTPRLQPDESESLWFKLLDSFCEPIMDSNVDKNTPEVGDHITTVSDMCSRLADDEECIIKWRILKSHKFSNVLKKLFSQFIKEIVEGMIGYVHLPTIMSKLLSENGSQEFGDFKITILGMLGTYGFERRILDTAKSLIESDTFYTMSLLKKGASHAYAPRSLICCICNCPLTKNSPSFSIRVFNCGHATHLQCELENESSSRTSLCGCPICMPKNAQKPKNKSFLPENGLVNKISSKPQRTQGTSVLHPHDDSFENYYGPQQISRYEILTNLQKDHRLVQIETMSQLRLAPPAVYHDRVKKKSDIFPGESSGALAKIQKLNKSKQLRDLKVKGSSLRFPLKTSIFGKEKTSRW